MNALQVIGQQRQDVLCAAIPFAFGDIDGTDFTPMFTLPKDAVLIGGALIMQVVTNAANIEVGDADDANSLLTATSGAALAHTAFDGADVTAGGAGAETTYGITASAELTEGSGVLYCMYVRAGRSCLTQG